MAAFASGGLVAANARGTRTNELIHICDMWSTFSILAGMNGTVDARAAAYNALNPSNTYPVPPIDSLNVVQALTALNGSSTRSMVAISKKAIILGKYKLIYFASGGKNTNKWVPPEFPAYSNNGSVPPSEPVRWCTVLLCDTMPWPIIIVLFDVCVFLVKSTTKSCGRTSPTLASLRTCFHLWKLFSLHKTLSSETEPARSRSLQSTTRPLQAWLQSDGSLTSFEKTTVRQFLVRDHLSVVILPNPSPHSYHSYHPSHISVCLQRGSLAILAFLMSKQINRKEQTC